MDQRQICAFYYALFHLMLFSSALKLHKNPTCLNAEGQSYTTHNQKTYSNISSPVFTASSCGTRKKSWQIMSGTGPLHFILFKMIQSFVGNFKVKTLLRSIKEAGLADYKLSSIPCPHAEHCQRDYIPAKQVSNLRGKEISQESEKTKLEVVDVQKWTSVSPVFLMHSIDF